jgi:phage major head subunit gpT-like protein
MAKITDYGVRNDLFMRLSQTPAAIMLNSLARVIDSKLPAGSSERFPFLGSTPSMREWIRERLIHNPAMFDFAIVNKKFELTLNMPLDYVKNDKTGEVADFIASMADAIPLWVRELIAGLIVGGASSKCFDGQNFFSTSHAYGKSGTFSNSITFACGISGQPTPLEAAEAINKALEAMKLLPDDQGRAIVNEAMTEVVITYCPGTANAPSIVSGINNKMLSTGTGTVDNPLLGQSAKITTIATGLLNATFNGAYPSTKFSLWRPPGNGGKPILYQENMEERQVAVVSDPNSEYVIKNDGWLVGEKVVGNVGYGMPQHAIECTFT